jgi:hypothetical protein
LAAPLLEGDAAALPAALAEALPLADVLAALEALPDALAEALPLADELVPPPPPPHAVNANNPAIPAPLFNNCRREICLDTPFLLVNLLYGNVQHWNV